MKRIERVYRALTAHCQEQQAGLDAASLAELVGASRQNVSGDLNELWRRGRVVKLSGRPVIFWSREAYEGPQGSAAPVPVQATEPQAGDPFRERMFGSEGSLRTQVEQAKAAVLYPPWGLHTLLVGPTGVGKSLMAELMHDFGVATGRFAPDLVTLNCADFAHNPQLLMGHLFGVAKGAYTGADQERPGLVDQANGGVLFLDEVHRLPAEGQEMLYRLIDKGVYHRLGEGTERQARVMLIAATTERVDSVLLRPFTRRIPMVIRLPALSEREAQERFRFLRRFFREEATKIGVDLIVSPQLLRMFMEYDCPGNIGQLRNDVRLTCARAFLHYLTHRQAPIELESAHLPEHLLRSLPPAREQRNQVADLLRAYPDGFLAVNGAVAVSGEEPPGEAISFYCLLEQQMQALQGQGLAAAAAADIVHGDIQKHFHAFLERVQRQQRLQRLELTTVVGQRVLAAVERAVIWAEGRLRRAISERMVYALALHVHASLQRHEQQGAAHLDLGVACDEAEWQVAAEMVDLLSRELGTPLPQGDVGFVYLLLQPADDAPTSAAIGIVVVAHGQGVASGMVQVANELTGVELAQGIDMALDQPPSRVVEALVAKAAGGSFAGGLLLLVDMGSLETIGEEVQQQTGVPVRTISLVSSPLVIEAVHQASIPGASLDQVYQAVLEGRSRALGRGNLRHGLPPVVVTFCFTGSGSALTLAQMVEEAVAGLRVEVVSASLGAGLGWPRLISTLLQANRLVAIVGPIDPKVPGVPYVSSEEMVTGEGARLLLRLCQGGEALPEVAAEQADPQTIYDLAAIALGRHLIFTNPQASVPLIARALGAIEALLERNLAAEVRVGLIMHMACLIERQVAELRQGVRPPRGAPHWLEEPLAELMVTFKVRFSPEQLGRLDEILKGSY